MRYNGRGAGLCSGPYWTSVQGTKRSSNLVNTLDAVNAVDPADIRKNSFKLALIHDFQAGFDAGVLAVRPAFQHSDVGAGIADDRGDFRQQSGAVLGANQKLDGESGGTFAAPRDGDAPFRLVKKILHVGARTRVHSHAPPA